MFATKNAISFLSRKYSSIFRKCQIVNNMKYVYTISAICTSLLGISGYSFAGVDIVNGTLSGTNLVIEQHSSIPEKDEDGGEGSYTYQDAKVTGGTSTALTAKYPDPTVYSAKNSGTTFENNSGTNAGAIYFDNSSGDIDSILIGDFNFINNKATDENGGGAIYSPQGEITIYRSNMKFSGNTVNGKSNDIYVNHMHMASSANFVLDGGIICYGDLRIKTSSSLETTENSVNIWSRILNEGGNAILLGKNTLDEVKIIWTKGQTCISLSSSTLEEGYKYMISAGGLLSLSMESSDVVKAMNESKMDVQVGKADSFPLGSEQSVLALGIPIETGATLVSDGNGGVREAISSVILGYENLPSGTLWAGEGEDFGEKYMEYLEANGVSDFFGSKSLLIVKGSIATDGKIAIQHRLDDAMSDIKTYGFNANIKTGAKLYISGVQNGKTYTILSGYDNVNVEGNGWSEKDVTLFVDNMLLDLKVDLTEKGTFKVIVSTAGGGGGEPTTVYSGLDGEFNGILNNLTSKLDVDSSMPGVKFLSRLTTAAGAGVGLQGDTNAAIRTLESSARIAAAGAAPQMTTIASETLSDAMEQRIALAGQSYGMKEQDTGHGITLWITPIWRNQSGSGLEACKLNYGYNANIGGLALGADYSFSEKWKAGLAFNIGGGYAESNGDLSKTKNNMNFWGLGLYGGYNDGVMSVMADVSFLSSYNKLKQELDSRMQMKDINAGVSSVAWSAGLRGDYKFKLDSLDITPHLGVRYTNVRSQEYDIKAGGTIAKSDGFQQQFWSFPVGVSFSKDFTTAGGWTLTPSVDLSVIPYAGDVKASEDIRYTDVDGVASLRTQTKDYISYKGTASIDAKYNNIGLSLTYSYEKGSATNSHGVNASFRWEF